MNENFQRFSWFPAFACFAFAQPLAAAPPVVLLNGFQLSDSIVDIISGRSCPPSTSVPRSASTFGRLEELLRAQGLQVAFFDNCVECPGRTIEECGQSLNRFLRNLTGEEGEADLVAHSMGGLIVRAYLAGKTLSGYAPPAKTRIRKVVFLGVPHFGSYTAVPLPLLPVQVSQLAEGSPFVWDLSTWNVGADDLRGVDALGIAGAGCPLGLIPEAGDGVVAVTSASLAFAREPERTRVLPYRHSPSVLGPCPARTALANIDSASHLSYRAIVSFLGGSEEWRAIGLSAAEHPALAATGGGIVEWQDEMGNRVSSTRLLSGAGLNWATAPQGRYQLNRHPAETTDLWFETAGGWTQNGGSAWAPALDVWETDDAFIVEASVPGIQPDNLDINLVNNMLTIQGEIKPPLENVNYLFQERRYGPFYRQLQINIPVQAKKTTKFNALLPTVPRISAM